MGRIIVGLSMLFCLDESFRSLSSRLDSIRVDHVELIDDGWHRLTSERVKKLKKVGKSQGLTYTLHAPFASMNIAALAEDVRDFFIARLERSMIFARELDCRIVVVHPGLRTGISSFYPGKDWDANIESVQKLLRFSEEYCVNVAIENCPRAYGFLLSNIEEFSRFFKTVGNDMGLVFDVGHSNLNGETHLFIDSFSREITHIHLHDNDGSHDLHLGIGHGNIDWERLASSLHKVNFKGVAIVESFWNIGESVALMSNLLR